MNVIKLGVDNIAAFEGLLPKDVTENIGREYFRGTALSEDEKPVAAMIWELRNTEIADRQNASEISCIVVRQASDAEKLFEEYDRDMQENAVIRSSFSLPAENREKLEDIFRAQGFSAEIGEGREVVVTLKDILGIRLLQKQKIPEHILPLSGLMVRKFRSGVADCILKSKRTLLSDLAMLPMNWYDPEVSCYTQCDDRVNGFLLVHVTPSKRLRVELFSATGPDSRIDLLNMLRFSLRAAGERYGPETEVVMIRRDEAAKKLIGYLFPGRKGRRIFTGKREE